jgi:hypothetical protein
MTKKRRWRLFRRKGGRRKDSEFVDVHRPQKKIGWIDFRLVKTVRKDGWSRFEAKSRQCEAPAGMRHPATLIGWVAFVELSPNGRPGTPQKSDASSQRSRIQYQIYSETRWVGFPRCSFCGETQYIYLLWKLGPIFLRFVHSKRYRPASTSKGCPYNDWSRP